MGSEIEPAKLILPYLQRADELQNHEPLVAYYCRLYAMERGLQIASKERTKTTNSVLLSLMNQLEKDKKSVKLGTEDNLYVEGFALNVFSKADNQDRAGRADVNTAKTFYAASIFINILEQFGELQPDLEQKRKYAIWKAADIRKALKEGRKPESGPPGGESVPSSGGNDLQRRNSDDAMRPDQSRIDQSSATAPESYSSSQHYDKALNIARQSSSSGSSYNHYPDLPPSNMESHPSSAQYDSMAMNKNFSEPSSTTRQEVECGSYQPSIDQIAEAHKAARFAVSALAFDDVPTAVSFLRRSLDLLTNPSTAP